MDRHLVTPCKGWPLIKKTYFRTGLDFIKHESVRPNFYSARGQSLIKRDVPQIWVRLVKYIYCNVPRPCSWSSLILVVMLPVKWLRRKGHYNTCIPRHIFLFLINEEFVIRVISYLGESFCQSACQRRSTNLAFLKGFATPIINTLA